MGLTREHKPKVYAIATATQVIELTEGQAFYVTPKSWEIWETKPLALVKRIPRKAVLWVIDGKDDQKAEASHD